MSILEKITSVPFNKKNYYDVEKPKKMIFIHHTASDANPYGVKAYWESTSVHVSTPFLVGGKAPEGAKWKDGEILQLYPSNRWAYHLGLTQKHLEKGGPHHSTNAILNEQSIAIEICNWGGLVKTEKGFKSYAGTIIPPEQVVTYETPFRGYKYYHKYTQAQIDNTGELLKFLCEKYHIPSEFKGMEMFDVDTRALCAEPGIWTHCSVRPASDKQDCHPQPELIKMLESL